MPRSTTFAGINRPLLSLVLLAELAIAASLVGWAWAGDGSARDGTPPPPSPAAASISTPAAASSSLVLPDGRTVALIGLGGESSAPLIARIRPQLADAAQAVTSFWGPDWPRDIVVAVAGTDEQFRVLAGGGPDIAATSTAERIVFAPGAAAMSDGALRIVLRHELFHYAAHDITAADAPLWLTEGVADFVARPSSPPSPDAVGRLPTDADFDTAEPRRSLAYDRAWWFSRFVADKYGSATLRALYLRACETGHPDAATAIRQTLGAGVEEVQRAWGQWLLG